MADNNSLVTWEVLKAFKDGCDKTYGTGDGDTVTPATDEQIALLFATYYAITDGTLTNCTISHEDTEAYSGKTVSVTATPATDYTYPITVTVTAEDGTQVATGDISAAGETFTFSMPAQPVTITASTTAKLYTIIGFTGMTASSGDLTWTDDIADLQSGSAYTTSTSGNYVTVTGALDNTWPFSEISEYTDSSGNTFIRVPKFYMKWVLSSSNVDGIQICKDQADDDYFIPDCFKSADGSTYNDYFYIGKYEGSGSSSRVYSVSGATCLVSISRANFRTGCRAYGSSSNNYNGYQQLDISIWQAYNFLCMMYYRTQNIQTVYAGRTSSSSAQSTGSCDNIAGFNGWNTSTGCVKMLGVENPYGNINKWVDGVYFSSASVYIHSAATNYADSTTNATLAGVSRPTSNGYIQLWRNGQNTATRSIVVPLTAAGGSSTYCGDYEGYSSTGTVLCVGGNWGDGSNAGLWYWVGAGSASSSYSVIGGRLCLRQ